MATRTLFFLIPFFLLLNEYTLLSFMDLTITNICIDRVFIITCRRYTNSRKTTCFAARVGVTDHTHI
jgi:hypothetical protein